MATYPCPYCGHPCLSTKEAADHCAGYQQTFMGIKPAKYTCPDCRGSGEKLDWLGTRMTCPRCGGSGKVNG